MELGGSAVLEAVSCLLPGDLPEVEGWSPIRIRGPRCELPPVGPGEAKRPEMVAGPL